MAHVILEPVGPERAETLANLFQFYVHDFADFWHERRVELGEDGRFPLYPPLPRYWIEPDRQSFLIRADGRLAGFVLLDREGHSGQLIDWNMGEFFVARHYRREGVGRAAALAAFRAHPGRWELAVARRNTPAQAFWRGVAAEAALGEIAERDQNDARWDGLVLTFDVAEADRAALGV
jgi:predicted acetyltransferase